jgi:hypothetical protein
LNPEGQLDPSVIRDYVYEDPQNTDLTHDIFYIEAQEKQNVEITIDISEGLNYNSDTTSDFIKSLVTTYLGSLEIGENLVLGSLMSYLYENADKQFLINNITLGGTSATNNDEYYPVVEEAGVLVINITGV